ncbi:MAG: WhiB family transcriptional regulator, partial [Acidimicrobiia bacterium]
VCHRLEPTWRDDQHVHSVSDDGLLDLLRAVDAIEACRPAWHRAAACRSVGTHLFFLEPGADPKPARALCATCPVTRECLRFAVETEAAGIWGGQSPAERRKARQAV